MSRRRVVITGVGVISSIGSDPSTFWNGILECRSGAGPITAFDATDYKTRFACEASGFDPSETMDAKLVRTVDRFTQMAIAASQQAVDDSGLEIGEDEDPQRFGVITGTGIGGLLEIENQHSILLERGPAALPLLHPQDHDERRFGPGRHPVRLPGAELRDRLRLRELPARPGAGPRLDRARRDRCRHHRRERGVRLPLRHRGIQRHEGALHPQ